MASHKHKGAVTLRTLAALLGYPDAALRAHLAEMGPLWRADAALAPERIGELEALVRDLLRRDPIEVETAYVELFDRGRATSLYLFEHVHGDSRDRGGAMVDLGQTYAQAGLLLRPDELPDYLPVVLEFASTQPPREARAFLGEIAHLVNAILGALRARGSLYATVPAALLELAGRKAEPVQLPPEPPMDDSWAEPPVFGGCATEGQARPGQPQPVRIVRTGDPSSTGAAR